VIAVDEAGRYAGLVLLADAHARDGDTRKTLRSVLHYQLVVLHPGMNIREAIGAFDLAEAESLAVVESGDNRPIGILTEAHAMRRYAEESERRRREVLGEV
jgi:CIC family chloride channel protein